MLALTMLAAAPVGCAGPGEYVWFSEVARDAPPGSEYVIAVGDLVNIRVLNQEPMATRVRVRSDGRIGFPIIGEIEARGKRPGALRAELEARLKDFLVAPTVTVNVEEAQPVTVFLLGEVVRPGAYPVDPMTTTLAGAIALGCGLTEYASRDRIFIVRSSPKRQRIRFTWEAVSRGEGGAGAFPLHTGDLVVVE
jgi:polysaccharide export outer membrane protein